MEKVIMKKFAKIVTVIAALALCLFSAYTPVAVGSLTQLTAAEAQDYVFSAPTQSSNIFTSEAVNTYDLANWTKQSDYNLLFQKVTATDNKHEDPLYAQTTLSASELNGRTPYIIANENNKRGNGYYSTDTITLPANGHYMIEVEYCLKSQDNNYPAFGTFYLNAHKAIRLKANGWRFATFYVHTDLLETASITPELYLGSRDELSTGAIYFNKFTVTAVNADKFQNTVFDSSSNLKVSRESYIDFTNTNAYNLVASFNNNQFTSSNGDIYNKITASSIPGWLGFNTTQHYFYNKDGSTSAPVMLMEAYKGNSTLSLDYTFQPQPHEVYMLQFYSIATAASEFSGFYLTIDPTKETTDNNAKITSSSHQVTTLTGDKYHNGWQLNTIFFIAGRDLFQAYNFYFSLATNGSSTTGWACVDDFKIYQVSGDYAENNATAAGVHDTYDMNTDTEPEIANAYFELGTSAAITNNTYPYPLKAKSWTTDPINGTENGIVNLAKWNDSFGTKPGLVSDSSYENNYIYMMHNSTRKHNTLISSALTMTAGETTHIAFDACSKTDTKTRAWVVTATADDNGNLTDLVYLGDAIDINEGRWQHYEFTINEAKYAVARSYYLLFEMDGAGYTYIDNVTKPSQADNNALTGSVDLTNPLVLDTIWESSDQAVTPLFTNQGLTITNENGHQTTVKNTFAYNLTQDQYYEFVINALGNHAYLSLTGYEGLLPINTEDETDYKLYLKVADSTTPNFQITLGSTEDTTANVVGTVTINSITVNQLEEADYNDAKENAALSGSNKLFLTPSTATDEEATTDDNQTEDNSFFGQNWWYLIPTLITAIAVLLAITAFLLRKIKFEKHITKKNTSYARDMRLKNQHNKIVAQKAAKVDNVNDETHNN